MAIRNSRAITFKSSGLSDAFDGTNVPPGAMAQLQNLIPAPQNKNAYVSRPAATLDVNLSPTFNTPIQAEVLFNNGSRIYGLIQSSDIPGHSVPFIYDTSAASFVAVMGALSANTPTSTSNTGEWTPPSADQVGSYILVTHPGFNFAGGYAFGWFDMSGFTASVTGNTVSGSAIITGNPVTTGLNPGMTISVSSGNIPANARVVSTGVFSLTESGTTHSNTTLDGLASTTGLAVGQIVEPSVTLGIGTGVTISAVGVGSVTLSAAATLAATAPVTFAGTTITITANMTGSHNGDTLSVAGGTFAAPLWAAGNLNINPLPAIPTWVRQYAGSACFAVSTTSPPSSAVTFSDAGSPLTCSNAPTIQTITLRNSLPITVLAGLGLQSVTQGGIVQSLIVFQGPSAIWQITGTPTLSNVALNALNDSTGTNSPNSVQATPKGLLFAAPDGIRRINLLGLVTEAIGRRGDGVTTPFMFAAHPTRMAAAYNESVYRISVQNGSVQGTPTQEYWYHEDDNIWTGPHTFPATVIVATQSPHSFASFAVGVNGKLWNTDAYATMAATYSENGVQMTFAWQTSLLPDNDSMSMNAMIQTNIAIAIPAQQTVQVTFTDETQVVDGAAQVLGSGTAPSLWGTAIWGTSLWGGGLTYFRQQKIMWPSPIVFKQGQLMMTGNCAEGLEIGNLYMLYTQLGFNILSATG